MSGTRLNPAAPLRALTWRARILPALGVAFGLAAPAASVPPETPAQMFKTQSGVRVIVRPDANNDSVAICIFIRAGAAEDDPPGIGSLVARGLFGRNQNQSPEQVEQYIYEVGGSLDAAWKPDYTVITCITSRAAFADAFYVLTQGLKGAEFDRETIDKARSEAVAIATRESTDPFSVAYGLVRSRLYDSSPVRNPFGGTPESLARIRAAACRLFLTKRYTPVNTIISVVGNVSADSVRRVAEDTLDNYSRPSRSAITQDEPALTESRRVTGRLATHTTTVMAGFRAPGLMDADYPALCVLTALLGEGKSSRLFRTVRDSAGLGYVVGAYTPSLSRDNHLLAFVEFDPHRNGADGKPLDTSEVEKLLMDTIQSVLTSPPDSREVERAKSYSAGTHALAHQRVRDRAFYLGWYEAVGRGFAFDSELPRLINAVTPADVLRVARKCLGQSVISVVQPEK